MTLGRRQHVVDLESGSTQQSVQACYRDAMRFAAADVERGALGCGDCEFAEGHGFAVEHDVAPGQHTLRWTWIGVDQLDGDVVLDPLGAVQGGGRRSGDRRFAARPQPRRSDACSSDGCACFGR